MRRCLLALVMLGCSGGAAEPTVSDAAATDTTGDSGGVTPEADTAPTVADTTADEGTVADEGTDVDTGPIAASCTNGTRDGDETDMDCGGGTCPKCVVGRTCGGPLDCASGSCGTDGVCGCTNIDHCPTGTNCVARLCVAPLASCAAQKSTHASPDGEYWIKPGAAPAYRAYCDMALAKEICNEAGGAVSGRTREGSATAWNAVAKLDHATGLCALHALKGPTYPYDDLKLVAGQTMSTCAAFGFKSDGTLGSCLYGTGAGRTTCGFTVTATHRYGNQCPTCMTNPGDHRNFILQGPFSAGAVLSNVSGTIKTTCRVR